MQVGDSVIFETLLEVLDSHEEFALFKLLKFTFLLEDFSPRFGVVFAKVTCPIAMTRLFETRVSDLLPWISNLHESDLGSVGVVNAEEIFDNITMSSYEALPLDETGCGDHVIIPHSVVDTTPYLVNRLHVCDKLLRRRSRQESSRFSMGS